MYIYIFIYIKRILDVSRARQRQAVSRCPGQGSSTWAWSFARRPTQWNTAQQVSRWCDPTPRGRQRTAGLCSALWWSPRSCCGRWRCVPVQIVSCTGRGDPAWDSGKSLLWRHKARQTWGCAASERRRPCIGCPESAARDSCPRSRQLTRSAHWVLGNLTQATSLAQPCAVVLKEHENAVLPAPAQIAQTQSSCSTPTANTQCWPEAGC